MTEMPESFAHYLAAWNEPDPDQIHAHLDRAVTADVVFADPTNRTVGPAELEQLIRGMHVDLPGAEFRLVSGVDGGHDHRYRYRWEVRMADATTFPGMDCTTVDDDGLITRLDGFFGDFAPFAP